MGEPNPSAPADAAAEPAPGDEVKLVRDYYAAINARDYAGAYRLWSDNGAASHQTLQQFAGGFADTTGVSVEIGTPGDEDAGAGQRYIEIPVTVTATRRRQPPSLRRRLRTASHRGRRRQRRATRVAHRLREVARNRPVTRARAALLLPLALVACGGPRSQQDAPAQATRPPSAQARHRSPRRWTAPPANASYVLPGVFAPDMDVERLVRRFGKDNVRIGEVPGAEGERVDGVVLFPDDPARRAYLYFEDAQRNAGLGLGVRVRPGITSAGAWTTASASARRCRTSCAATAGRSASSRLDWDYGNNITVKGGGRLNPKDDQSAAARPWARARTSASGRTRPGRRRIPERRCEVPRHRQRPRRRRDLDLLSRRG
ncbi:MAG: hypothetical protein U1F20_07520 [Lysobacterales bacterium]